MSIATRAGGLRETETSCMDGTAIDIATVRAALLNQNSPYMNVIGIQNMKLNFNEQYKEKSAKAKHSLFE